MFISLSADLTGFEWYVYEKDKTTIGKKLEFNPRQTLRLAKGDVYGVKRTTRGPTAGSFQVVLAAATHVTFRAVPFRSVTRILEDSKKTKDPGTITAKTAGVRAVRFSTAEEKAAPNKQRDSHYKPTGIVEKSTYDKDHYQWRTVTATGKVNIVTLKQGRNRGSVDKGDTFGLRYITPAKGGYILLDSGLRVNITHELYEKLVLSSRILPPAKQQKGLVFADEVKAALPKQTRNLKRDEFGEVIRRSKKLSVNTAPPEAVKQGNTAPTNIDRMPISGVKSLPKFSVIVEKGKKTGLIVMDIIPEQGVTYVLYNQNNGEIIKLPTKEGMIENDKVELIKVASPAAKSAAIRAYTRYSLT